MTLGLASPPVVAPERGERRAVTESALMHGYSRAVRQPSPTEPCACGGFIVTVSLADRDVADAILAHNVTPRHIAWREREDIA